MVFGVGGSNCTYRFWFSYAVSLLLVGTRFSVGNLQQSVPGFLLSVGHTVVFGSAVAVGLGEHHVTSIVLAQFHVIGPIEVSVDFHFVVGQRTAAIGVIVEQIRGLRDFDVVQRA